MKRTVASAWHGTYLLEEGTAVREARAPLTVEALAERARTRSEGSTTPEEDLILAARGSETWGTRDRRLVRTGVVFEPTAPEPPAVDADASVHRLAVLRRAEQALAVAWDPTVHVMEAVRALRDLDRAANLLGERVASWAALDLPGASDATPAAAARMLLERPERDGFSPEDPSIGTARRRLAELVLSLEEVRSAIDAAVRASAPVRAPNLNRLLGPELAGRLIAQAGGLDRLAQLPASTVQVLGAERAFFEHLRGRASPPRHGLLFLHPAVQTAPRSQRGRLARALAAKAAIAARLDRAGAEVHPAIAEAFEKRRAAIRSAGTAGARTRRGRPPTNAT